MPCYRCSNNKYKYGEKGRCQFDTLSACLAAERAIHARESQKYITKSEYFTEGCEDCNSGVEHYSHKPYND